MPQYASLRGKLVLKTVIYKCKLLGFQNFASLKLEHYESDTETSSPKSQIPSPKPQAPSPKLGIWDLGLYYFFTFNTSKYYLVKKKINLGCNYKNLVSLIIKLTIIIIWKKK